MRNMRIRNQQRGKNDDGDDDEEEEELSSRAKVKSITFFLMHRLGVLSVK